MGRGATWLHRPPAALPLPASLPGRTSLLLQGCPSHPGVGGAPCFACSPSALLTHQGSICNRVRPHSSTAAGETHASSSPRWQDLGHASQAPHGKDLLLHALALGHGWISEGHADEPGEALQGIVGVEES